MFLQASATNREWSAHAPGLDSDASFNASSAAVSYTHLSADDAQDSTGGSGDSYNDIADYSDLGWEEQTWNFTCSTTETSTWACLLYTSRERRFPAVF